VIKDTIWIDISHDGDKWCALVGDNIQEGIAGFGETPLEALEALINEFRTTPWNLRDITIG